MSAVRQLYTNLCVQLRDISYLSGIQGLLDWDQNVMMPPGSADVRGRQCSALAGVLHEKQTSELIGSILNQLETIKKDELEKELDAFEVATIRDAIRYYKKAICVPKDLAKEVAELSASGYAKWVKAREDNDFALFAPVLEKWVDLLKKKATYIDPTKPAYEVLLDDFERGMTTSRIDTLFNDLKKGLIPLIQRIQASPNKPDTSFLQTTFPIPQQKEFNLHVATTLGFDLNCGRLDTSVHPFTGGSHPTDTRMTTRYHEDNFIEGVTGTIHETGHALYEQGRNKKYEDLPVSEAMSMGLHESQSLLWERMVGLSREFWEWAWPHVGRHFPEMKSVEVEKFYRAINESKPGFIRVEADEVTYPLHIIIRYEIEKGLFDGTIQVKDLPQIWNDKMKEYLGIVPENDTMGVLQDTHWSCGLFGYFPTYTIGAIYANQFFKTAQKAIPNLMDDFKKGDFSKLKTWLNKNVHEKGSLHGSGDLLVKEITGGELNAKLYVDYLTQKYSTLYHF